MADNEKSLIRRIVAIFDRASAQKVEAELEASLQKAGQKGGENFVRELRAAFDKRMAELKVNLAKGLIDPKQFRAQSAAAAKEFNAGIIAGLEKARAAGTLTDKEFQKLARTLKTVGTAGESAWARIKAGIVRAGAALASFFAVQRLIQFGRESVTAAIAEQKAFDELAVALANVGIAYEDVQEEIKQTTRALEDSNLTDDEAAGVLSRLITLTRDYQGSLKNVGLVANVAAAYHKSLEEAATLVGKVMNGNLTPLQRMGIHAKDAADGIRQLTEASVNAARDTAQPIERLSKQWGEFKEAIGRALLVLIGGDEGFQRLTDAIRNATHWLEDNQGAFAKWGRVAITAIYAVIQALLLLPRTIDKVSTILSEAIFAFAGGNRDMSKMREAWQGLKKDWADTEAAALESGKAIRIALGIQAEAPAVVTKHRGAVQGLTDDLDENTDATKRNTAARKEAAKGPPADPEKAAEKVGFPERFQTPEEQIQLGDKADLEANADRAAEFVTPWTQALAAIRSQVDAERGLFAELGEAWAFGGIAGVAQLAKWKVKENLARVIEETAKGIGALFLNPAAAAAHFKSAATHGAAAAAWKALGGAAGGGGGGSGSGSPSGGSANTGRAAASEVRGADVSIYLTGPGFDALNPTVQRVVWGAQQMARERFGENANITVRRSN